MVWKVRADCTYTTAANKTARQTAVESLLASYPEAALPLVVARFPGGVVSQSTTRFTVAYDFADAEGSTATAFAAALTSAVTASARSSTLVSIHMAGGAD